MPGAEGEEQKGREEKKKDDATFISRGFSQDAEGWTLNQGASKCCVLSDGSRKESFLDSALWQSRCSLSREAASLHYLPLISQGLLPCVFLGLSGSPFIFSDKDANPLN